MFEITEREQLNENVVKIKVSAPLIAKKAKAGQFIILRINEQGERIPLTIADYDAQAGTVTVIFQIVGKTTELLSKMYTGDCILDFTGPLGMPTHLEGYRKACVIGGGVGCAIAYPSAKALYNNGTDVDVITGFRSRDIVILENEFKQVSDNLFITTDDGSYGVKGFVTDELKRLIESGNRYDLVLAIGPVPMMKFISKMTKEYGIKTIVSLNPIMIDGTGMCGGCRVNIGGEIKFACVDGPDFDGHSVDYDELIQRNKSYLECEKESKDCIYKNIARG